MYVFRIIIIFISCLVLSCTSKQSTPALQRVAFGSCLKIQYSTDELWNSILSTKPNIFLFAGDNVYADSTNIDVLYTYYQKLEDEAGFRRLRSRVPILAVYDDHDYGISDGGKENPIKDEVAKACLDFFQVPVDDPRRKSKGVYGSYSYGSEGKRTQVILLDTRYFRDPLVKATVPIKRYAPNPDPKATLLGEEQWQWLDKTLKEEADLRIIVSSIQVIPDKRGLESWGNFPLQRKKLFETIIKNNANGVIFVSGDAHFSEASSTTVQGYPFYEVTSSALAHNHNTKDGKPTIYSGFPNEYRIKGSDYTAGNFGLISVDWQGKETKVLLELKKTSGESYFKHELNLKDLQKK